MHSKSQWQKSNRWQDDYYTQKAQKEGYVARSVYKLQEIDQKFHLIDPSITHILDIGCAPGSWIQYMYAKLQHKKEFRIVGIDVKPITIHLPNLITAVQDATDASGFELLLQEHHISKFDLIVSDMAPDTTANTDLDAIKSIEMIEHILRIVDRYLPDTGKAVFKIFMGPGFDAFVASLKHRWGGSHLRLFKPQASRKASKETFIIKL